MFNVMVYFLTIDAENENAVVDNSYPTREAAVTRANELYDNGAYSAWVIEA